MSESGGSVEFTAWDEVCETQDEPDGTMSFFPHKWQDAGHANLDDCEICGATRQHPQSGRTQ